MRRGGVIAWVGLWGSWLLRAAVTFAASFVAFTVLRKPKGDRDAFQPPTPGALPPVECNAERSVLPRTDFAASGDGVFAKLAGTDTISRFWLAAHLGALTVFVLLGRVVNGTTVNGQAANHCAVVWILTGVSVIATGAFQFIPVRFWRQFLRATGDSWIYALAISVGAGLLTPYARSLWRVTTEWTFFLVERILALFVSGVVANPQARTIGTQAFNVEIAPECSGLEGAALILGFCALWLWLARREFRFPRALLLIPAGVAVLFFLNACRIAALILIGNAGAPEIALGGFHSQAGWIAFNGVAIAIMVTARRVQWITVSQPPEAALAARPAENPALPYLLPFLLILAAAMISHAGSGGFEWLYPLRLFAAGTALWVFRGEYKKLDWHFGWEAPAVGALVFVLWLGGDWLTGVHPQNPLTGSANSWVLAQAVWLALRVLSSIVTAPIAEELAFRGYLIRRVISPNFEHLSLKTFTVPSLIISSLAFGLLHGERWIAGTIAGLLYAAVLIRRGRIGDAVVAHATTNGLLAASVLITGQWNLS